MIPVLPIRSPCPNSPWSLCRAVQSMAKEQSHSSGLGRGWAEGTGLKVPGVLRCSRALLPKYEENTPLDTVS